jgi:peptidase M15-like protein
VRLRLRLALIAVGVAGVVLSTGIRAADRFDSRTASFALSFHDETSAYRDTAIVVMPGGSAVFNAIGGPPGDFAASTADGTLVQQGQRQWKWTAPDRPGTYRLTVEGPARNDTIDVHAFVAVPAADVRDGLLNGYPIGEYPARPRGGNPIYRPPPGFIEVTKQNEETRVSPHFTLRQFLCKEDTTKSYPKYVVLNERLPLELELVLEHVNGMGVRADTLHVMSAYRTPYYNHAIGDVPYSMHQWGRAADIYVDPGNRDRMEDLNRDGRVDAADSKLLSDRIDALLARPEYRQFQGGIGFYPATAAHPPFVHVDVRGAAARWQG